MLGGVLERLPVTYAKAMRLREQGETDEAIAARLGIEPEAVEPLVRIGEAKLAALRRPATPEHGAPGR
jgi:hypothetical protein